MPRRPKRVATHRRRQPRRRLPPLGSLPAPPGARAAARSARSVDALKQRHLRVLEAAVGEVRLDCLLGPVVRRHVVALCRPSRAAAATPAAPAGSSSDAASPPPRSPARSCRPSRTLKSARSRNPTNVPRVDSVEEHPRRRRRQHRRRREPRATRTARAVPASSPEPAAAGRPRRPPRAADSAGPGADCRLRSRQPTRSPDLQSTSGTHVVIDPWTSRKAARVRYVWTCRFSSRSRCVRSRRA